MNINAIQTLSKRTLYLVAAVVLATMSFLVVFQNSVSAGQLTSRAVTLGTAVKNTSTTYKFDFTLPSTAVVQGIQIQFCDTPIGTTCNGANNPTLGAVTTTAQSGWSQTPAWGNPTVQTNAGGGSASSNELQLTRTGGTSGSAESAAAKSLTFNTITNRNADNVTFYARIRLYNSNATFNGTTLVHDGNVAGSTSQTLNVAARVQEVLQFCVNATAINDATTTPGADCTAVTAATPTLVDLGIVDSSTVFVSPVAAGTSGNSTNGIAMLRTNASGGTVISYTAIQDSGSGQLKVPGATCTGSSTDQCFNSQGATQATFSAGFENFGFTIGGVNCGSATSGAYTCNYATGLVNLRPLSSYIGGAFTAGTSGTYGTTTGFAFVDGSGTFTNIANTTGTNKYVDDEALILRFAATAGTQTPAGSYQANLSYLAIATY